MRSRPNGVRTIVAGLAVILLASACTVASSENGGCPDPVVLAAPADINLAYSCADPGILYRGERFTELCFPLHPSRVGKVLEGVSGGSYSKVRAVKGYSNSDALLLGDGNSCKDQRALAVGERIGERGYRELFLPHQSVKLKSPELVLSPGWLKPVEATPLFIGAPDSFIWGVDAYLQNRVGGRWKDFYLIYTDPHESTNESHRLDSEAVGIRDIGFSGSRIIWFEMPHVPKDRYRIRKTFVIPASASTAARRIDAHVEFHTRKP